MLTFWVRGGEGIRSNVIFALLAVLIKEILWGKVKIQIRVLVHYLQISNNNIIKAKFILIDFCSIVQSLKLKELLNLEVSIAGKF